MIAAIYARKSTEQNGVGDEEKSVTRQIEHAKAYATKKGWTVQPFFAAYALACSIWRVTDFSSSPTPFCSVDLRA